MPLLHSRIDTSGLANAPLAAAQADQARAATAKTKYDLAAAPVKAAADAKQQKFENVVKVWGPVMQEYAKSTSMTAEQRQAAMQGVVDHISKDPKNADIKDAFFALDGVEFMAPEGTYKLGSVGYGEDKTLSVMYDSRKGTEGIEAVTIGGQPAVKKTTKTKMLENPVQKVIQAELTKKNEIVSGGGMGDAKLKAQYEAGEIPDYKIRTRPVMQDGVRHDIVIKEKATKLAGENAFKMIVMEKGATDLLPIKAGILSGKIDRGDLVVSTLPRPVIAAIEILSSKKSEGEKTAFIKEWLGSKGRTIKDRFGFAREAFSRALSGAAIPEHEVVRFEQMFGINALDPKELIVYKIDRMNDIANSALEMIQYGVDVKERRRRIAAKLDEEEGLRTEYERRIDIQTETHGEPSEAQRQAIWDGLFGQ